MRVSVKFVPFDAIVLYFFYLKGGADGLRWKFKRDKLLRIWRLVCQLYDPERKPVKSFLVWLLDNGDDYPLDR